MNQCKSFVRFAVCVLAASACVILAGDAPGGVAKADGEQFTFTVPVRLTRVDPSVNRGRVLCKVYSGPGRTAADVVGRGWNPEFDIPANGEYSGEVVVRFNADQGKDPSSAREYVCSILLRHPSVMDNWQVPTPNPPAAREWAKCHEGDRVQISGMIPQQ